MSIVNRVRKILCYLLLIIVNMYILQYMFLRNECIISYHIVTRVVVLVSVGALFDKEVDLSIFAKGCRSRRGCQSSQNTVALLIELQKQYIQSVNQDVFVQYPILTVQYHNRRCLTGLCSQSQSKYNVQYTFSRKHPHCVAALTV